MPIFEGRIDDFDFSHQQAELNEKVKRKEEHGRQVVGKVDDTKGQCDNLPWEFGGPNQSTRLDCKE